MNGRLATGVGATVLAASIYLIASEFAELWRYRHRRVTWTDLRKG